jgi:hypothetical protein
MNTDPTLVCHACLKRKLVRQGLMVCTVDERDIREHAENGDCPEGRFEASGDHTAVIVSAAPAAAGGDWRVRGPLLWAELDAWSRTADLSTPEGVRAAQAWLDRFAARVDCGECRRHWLELLQACPPDFTSNAALYAWRVEVQNRVNDRLGKPRWSPPTGLTDQHTSLKDEGTPGSPASGGKIEGSSKPL